jgi:hypothetical protein
MTKHHSGGGACFSRKCKEELNASFGEKMNALRYKADGTLKTKSEIRAEMNEMRKLIGVPIKRSTSSRTSSSRKPKSSRRPKQTLRRSARIREQTLRRSARITAKNRNTMGGRSKGTKYGNS